MTDFIFLGSKITMDSDCSHDIKRHLLFGRKAMTNLVVVQSLSHVQLLATPWTAAYQAPPSMGFSRQDTLLRLKKNNQCMRTTTD